MTLRLGETQLRGGIAPRGWVEVFRFGEDCEEEPYLRFGLVEIAKRQAVAGGYFE